MSDTIWFKFNVYGQINQNAIAVNILFDTDLNQNNGQRWYGTNRKYHFDIAATLWVRYERTKYQGIVGITDSEGARKQNWNKLIQDNISFYVDHENDSYLVGVKKTDIAKDLNTFNVIGTIGEYYWWNDDIGDSDYATISLDE